MSFVVRTYLVWILAAGVMVIGTFAIWPWFFVPTVPIVAVITAFLQCNNCGHKAFADAAGNGRTMTDSCAKCGASLEDVYPFSYVRKNKQKPPS